MTEYSVQRVHTLFAFIFCLKCLGIDVCNTITLNPLVRNTLG